MKTSHYSPYQPIASCSLLPDEQPRAAQPQLYVDAGVGHIRFLTLDEAGRILEDECFPSNTDLPRLLQERNLASRFGAGDEARIYLGGKLAPLVREALGYGKTFLSSATAWLAARRLLERDPREEIRKQAVVELSASGYLVVGVDRDGQLQDDLLVVNPRCGAGSGVNLDRVLQKLGLGREDVDCILATYLGEENREKRQQVSTRADRCGVFSASATISDKNQGIPLAVALATTLKSEVLKACRKLPAGFQQVCLTGRVFHWQFARDCAADLLREQGVLSIQCDPDNTEALLALQELVQRVGHAGIAQPEHRLLYPETEQTYPAFEQLRRSYEADLRFLRQESEEGRGSLENLKGRVLDIGLDVGSTMAKLLVSDADSGEVLAVRACSNAGDTMATIQRIWLDFREAGLVDMQVHGIGITGSARYQVQQALERIYPELAARVPVLVENYAHARGSIRLAREHVARLVAQGVQANQDFCVLVDIGGEDTKISTIALKEAELFNNAMNLKCSAGTGSLMDTLAALFGMDGVAAACQEAYGALRSRAINATCAVFLMENARKLQARGVARAEILASANWAIVENMARTLWNQVELPANTVVLLHGQTMLSDPLPLAVTHRLQDSLDGHAYALVPPHPGHRACYGLIGSLAQTVPQGSVTISLEKFLSAHFEKRIIQCKGAACGDDAAVCNRTMLTCRKEDGSKLLSFSLGGCSAINELVAKKQQKQPTGRPVRDTYKEIWDFVDSRQPRSEAADRLVIPRSFAVSEWAYLFASLFQRLGLAVHVDNVQAADLNSAQPHFNIDTCAPHMGAVGQYARLAALPHGLILAPQIEFLPTDGKSLGRTCTLNQGGVAVALNLARLEHPDARFSLFNVDLSVLDGESLRCQLQERLQPVFDHYGLNPDTTTLGAAIAGALEDHFALRRDLADFAADLAEEALADGTPLSLVVGREYILNPGIYDSHVRRLLRDKQMAVLPSYVLDLNLNPDYGHIYWRNPHAIVSILDAVSRKTLHQRLRHPRLQAVFRQIEGGPELLPVVQISTFCCGPDSTVQPLIAEIMKQRPFLLIQSDAIIQELAHLENRVNTYVKQLQLGLHEQLRIGSAQPLDVRCLDELTHNEPIDRQRDVIYVPTMSDNRTLTAVLRSAGFTCIDNYRDHQDLQRLVQEGRQHTGDSCCAPLAGVYADLERAQEDFQRRQLAGDPLVAGKRRLLYFDNKGTGPCRQGQYVHVHQLLHHRRQGEHARDVQPGQGLLKFLVAQEESGYNVGVEEWVLARSHQALILQGVLHSLLFTGGAACRDYDEYQHFLADYRQLKQAVLQVLESFPGPGPLARRLLRWSNRLPGVEALIKYQAYGLHGADLRDLLRTFAQRWIDGRTPADALPLAMTGEAYMRVAQSEDLFRHLLAHLGFRRFRLNHNPVWSYMEWICEEAAEVEEEHLQRLRQGGAGRPDRAAIRDSERKQKRARNLQVVMRRFLAAPLYRAAGIPLPPSCRRTTAQSRELLPTLRPLSEISTYVGEVLEELRHGARMVLNVAPTGCMVASMGEALTPAIQKQSGTAGRIQHLFSADGEINEELLTLALLKTMGPEGFYRRSEIERKGAAAVPQGASGAEE
jgi:activator of 2-hydroxyglutaryl-CoA dehydratase/predicted nucleotide-binding protein (sugar kinase/HSP70/actin superfamily)